jgi:uncharacterized protein (DUF1330 family)
VRSRLGLKTVSAYVIADLDVRDPKKLAEYAELVPKTVAKFGGRYLVRAGKFEVIEGDWKPTMLVVLEFPSWDAAMNWYNSEEYRPLKQMRIRSATTDGVLVEGVSPAH